MATAAGALVARARREIQHHFFAEDAVRRDRAVSFTPASRIERRVFEKWLSQGVICSDGQDHYWIDVIAYDRAIRREHRIVRNILGVVVLILLLTIAIKAITTGW
jgi:hypothetical protein